MRRHPHRRCGETLIARPFRLKLKKNTPFAHVLARRVAPAPDGRGEREFYLHATKGYRCLMR
jgi:hypothetical protein